MHLLVSLARRSLAGSAARSSGTPPAWHAHLKVDLGGRQAEIANSALSNVIQGKLYSARSALCLGCALEGAIDLQDGRHVNALATEQVTNGQDLQTWMLAPR